MTIIRWLADHPAVLWFREHPTVLGLVTGLSFLVFLSSLIVMPLLVARMRSDYFLNRKPPSESWAGQHPAIRFLALGLKNGIGLVLFVAGIAMLVLPGQGVLTILIAISLLDFPGKRSLELAIVRQRHVFNTINWIRKRAKRPGLILPERETPIL